MSDVDESAVDAQVRAAQDEYRRTHDKVEALHNLGPEGGAGALIWAQAIRDTLALHEAARDDARDASAMPREAVLRLIVTPLMLVVAIDQVRRAEVRLSNLTRRDAELVRARRQFDDACPDAEALRNLVTHLDAYAVGQGDRQRGKGEPLSKDVRIESLVSWVGDGGATIELVDKRLDVRRASDAALELADVVERVRRRHLDRATDEANAALRDLGFTGRP